MEVIMNIRSLLAVALVVSGAACSRATQLEPGPGAMPAPAGPGEGAVASDAGVQVEVRTDAWRGDPATLEQVVTPVFVELTNNSTHPVLVRYESVKLRQNGQTYEAMPPYDVEGSLAEPFTIYDYPYSGFEIAPHLRRYYPRLRVADPFWWDRAFYDRMVPAFRSVALPTSDMVRMALPEGVLDPGGRVAGFVYFEDVDDDIPNVTFTTDLVDPGTRMAFGRVEIPFVAH
jgi:hypothetical protein